MKKVVLALAVVFSVALVSCSSKENKAADSDSVVADTTEVVEESAAVDSVAPVADSVVADSAK